MEFLFDTVSILVRGLNELGRFEFHENIFRLYVSLMEIKCTRVTTYCLQTSRSCWRSREKSTNLQVAIWIVNFSWVQYDVRPKYFGNDELFLEIAEADEQMLKIFFIAQEFKFEMNWTRNLNGKGGIVQFFLNNFIRVWREGFKFTFPCLNL